jgi:D-3-phosphoglycerate dehydrogenase
MLHETELRILTLHKDEIDPNSVRHIFSKLNFRLTDSFLSNYPNLTTVVTPTTGIDHIDSTYCNQRKIQIISLRDTQDVIENFSSTSEIATWLMLSLMRKTTLAAADVKAGNWRRNEFLGNTLRGKTVGIVGFGRLGMQFSRICASFGMRVTAYDLVNRSDDSVTFFNSLEELIAQADVISLHVDDRRENLDLVNAALLSNFRSDAILINTSRGFIVNEKDVVNAIQRKRIGAYGTDVLAGEHSDNFKWLTDSVLWQAYQHDDSRIIILPHIGGGVRENIPAAEMAVLKTLVERIH